MSDLGDLLGLAPARRRPRARTRCRDCSRPVYVDQLVFGLGRCCAEKAGLIVRRYRLPAGQQAGETLLDYLPAKETRVEPFPQIRIDVAGLDAETAHRKIVEHARSMISDPTGEIAAAYPAGITAATDDAFRGLVGILERHAPHLVAGEFTCDDHDGQPWPCLDYRDAARGLATGLPADPDAHPYTQPGGAERAAADRALLADPDAGTTIDRIALGDRRLNDPEV